MLQGSHLLVVDDERTTRLTLSEIFSLRGAIVSIAGSGEEALKLIEQTHFDLIILDIKMPGISGLEVLDSVHVSSPSTIVILLTAHATVDSAIKALRQGAFDYILKPAQPRVIIEVVERGLAKRQEFVRRQNLVGLMEQTVEAFKGGVELPPTPASPAAPIEMRLQIGDLAIDLDRREARMGDQLLDLTPTEFDTLAYLAHHAERVISCRELVQAVHGYETTEHAARPIMRVHIHRLRQKIEFNATGPLHLLTIRSAGYMLVVHPRPQ